LSFEEFENLVKPFPLVYGDPYRRFFMRNIMALSLALFLTLPAHAAYYGVLDSGEVLQSGKYKFTGDAQALTENGGLNLGASFDMGFQEEFGLRGLVGFGKTDFYAGGLFKWMPIPDLDNQPAMGFNVGILYGKDGDVSDMTVRFEPLMSKRLTIEQTTFTPYVSLPVGVRVRDTNNPYINDDTKMTFQLVLGSQLQVEAWKNLQFIGEVGIDLDEAPGYLSIGAILYFDGENGFSLN